MPLDKDEPFLRRKVTPRTPASDGGVAQGSGPAADLVRAVSRILSSSTPLMAEDATLHRKSASLPELLDAIEPDSYVTTLFGGTANGLALIDQPGFVALIEAMTIGRLSPRAPAPRRATATDSALLAGFLDGVLADLRGDVAADHRCGRPMPDHRLIGVLLDDGLFDLVAVTARLVCGDVSRPVRLLLALPCAKEASETPPVAQPAADWRLALESAVLAAPSCLRAELGRITLPLFEVLELGVGSAMILPLSALEDIQLVGLDDTVQAAGRLGQSRGNRAVRLTRLSDGSAAEVPMQEVVTQASKAATAAGAPPALP